MRKLALLITGLFIGFTSVSAQDTLLFEDFNDTIGLPPLGVDAVYPLAITGDTMWSNYDEDQLPDGSPNSRPGEWFWSTLGTADSLTQGFVFGSNSWTNDYTQPVKNWLITPAIQITDGASAMVSWKSCPFQTPAYLDAYVVLVSTTTNDLSQFTDTLFMTAEYDDLNGGYVTYCGDFTPYTFTPAGEFVHGADGNFIEVNADFDTNPADTTCTDSSRFNGLLRPFSQSLAAYDNQMIYIAFVHNSTDDNILYMDDILITENTDPTFGIEVMNDFIGSVYPNPAAEYVNVNVDIDQYHNAQVQLLTSNGQMVYAARLNTVNHRIDLMNVSSGVYFVKVITDEGSMVKKVIVSR